MIIHILQVSLYGYALLGLEDSSETVRFRKIETQIEESGVKDEEEQHYSSSQEVAKKEEDKEYEEPKRRVRVSSSTIFVLGYTVATRYMKIILIKLV